MVARGDLGIEIDATKVFVQQKRRLRPAVLLKTMHCRHQMLQFVDNLKVPKFLTWPMRCLMVLTV